MTVADGLDPYATLGVPPGASQDEVKSAYRKLAMQHHPDQHPPAARAEAEESFKRVQQAYSRLTAAGPGSEHVSTQARPGQRHGSWQQGRATGMGNRTLALVLTVPLALAGVKAAWSYGENDTAGPIGRHHGFMYPPVNPFYDQAWSGGGGGVGGAGHGRPGLKTRVWRAIFGAGPGGGAGEGGG